MSQHYFPVVSYGADVIDWLNWSELLLPYIADKAMLSTMALYQAKVNCSVTGCPKHTVIQSAKRFWIRLLTKVR